MSDNSEDIVYPIYEYNDKNDVIYYEWENGKFVKYEYDYIKRYMKTIYFDGNWNYEEFDDYTNMIYMMVHSVLISDIISDSTARIRNCITYYLLVIIIFPRHT